MLFSIIVSVYNAEKYLTKCLNSIINQSFEDFEVILIDDGSTDSSSTIYEEFKIDKRIRIIRKKNEGVSIARQIGVAAALGDYLVFVDSDDWLKKDCLLNFSKVIELYSPDVVCCNYYDSNGKKIFLITDVDYMKRNK